MSMIKRMRHWLAHGATAGQASDLETDVDAELIAHTVETAVASLPVNELVRVLALEKK